MMGMRTVSVLIAFLSSGSALALPADDLADLVGARGAGGETQLEARGYSFVTTNTVRDIKWSFWYSERARQCVQVATSNGRYTAINRVPEANCRLDSDNSPQGHAPPRADDRESVYRRQDSDRSYGVSMTLVCYGQGSGPAAQSYSRYRYNSETGRYEPEFGNRLGREDFASDVQVEIRPGRGRIHLARKLISPIHSGGTDDWWPIDNLMTTPDRITGSYRLNGMNKPRLDIDLRSRTIRISAATNFTGRCDSGDWRGSGF